MAVSKQGYKLGENKKCLQEKAEKNGEASSSSLDFPKSRRERGAKRVQGLLELVGTTDGAPRGNGGGEGRNQLRPTELLGEATTGEAFWRGGGSGLAGERKRRSVWAVLPQERT